MQSYIASKYSRVNSLTPPTSKASKSNSSICFSLLSLSVKGNV